MRSSTRCSAAVTRLPSPRMPPVASATARARCRSASRTFVRSAGAAEIFELFWRYGARDFRSIGHKAIYVANAWRALHAIGWRHAEPVLRSLAYALLETGGDRNPPKNSYPADIPGRENAERLLGSGRFVIAFPEGMKGAAKVFRERYRVKRFGRGGVIRVALESGVPLVPVGVVGAEEAHPVLFKWHTAARTLGLPFVPVTPTFPLLGPLGALPLPTKWVIRIGEPLALRHFAADAARDELLISRLTADLRERIQGLIDAGLAARESIWG